MENLDKKQKDINICFKVDEDLSATIDEVLKEQNWKKSAFIRVCIQKEILRLAEDK